MEKEPEIWKPIPGYEGLYEVSNHGRVKRLRDCKLIKYKPTDKYRFVVLENSIKNKTFTVHRLVAKVFIDNPKNLPFVNHKNFDKSDNYYKNLEWVNRRENESHKRINDKTTSLFVGVSYKNDKNRKKKWRASLSINNIAKHLGYFDTEEEAHQAYLDALKRYNLKNKYATKPPE